MLLTLEVPIEKYGYHDNQLEIDVTYIAEGMLNIMVDGKAPSETEMEIIAENIRCIQESVAYELREKETNRYGEVEEFITSINKIQRQIGG